eukprot:m.778454 g.778454  ORF g.778454 m.778454 type:complete len:74 (+) comp59121_c0_seq104:2519-2740(+)
MVVLLVDDFAAIVLVDERYALPRISSKLPSWIASELETVSRVSEFFWWFKAPQFDCAGLSVPGLRQLSARVLR